MSTPDVLHARASDPGDIVLVAWDGFGVGSRYAATHREQCRHSCSSSR
jgi:hypothetical protein